MGVIEKSAIKPITADRISTRFYASQSNSFYMVMPNVHIERWAECDLLCIAKSGYASEIEIKISRADFFADRKKTVQWTERYGPYKRWWVREFVAETKHDALGARRCFPNRFYYCAPKDLIAADEIPEWAGLYTISSDLHIHKEKEAPLLHKQKPSDDFLAKQTRKFVFRCWQERMRTKQGETQ